MRGNKPNKRERLKVYKFALDLYKEDIRDNIYNGMCYAIHKAMIELCGLSPNVGHNESCYNIDNEYYPEFYSIRPEDVGAYWWDMEDTKSRIDAFNKMILVLKK